MSHNGRVDELFDWTNSNEEVTTAGVVSVSPSRILYATNKSVEHVETVKRLAVEHGADAAMKRLPRVAGVPMKDVREVRWSPVGGQLVIAAASGGNGMPTRGRGRVVELGIPKRSAGNGIFRAISSHANGKQSREGLGIIDSLKGPASAFGIAVFIGAILYGALMAGESGYEPSGRRSGMIRLVMGIANALGHIGILGLFGGIAAIALFVLAARILNRPQVQILTVADAGGRASRTRTPAPVGRI